MVRLVSGTIEEQLNDIMVADLENVPPLEELDETANQEVMEINTNHTILEHFSDKEEELT